MSNKFLRYYAVIFPLIMIAGCILLYHCIPDIITEAPSVNKDKIIWEAPSMLKLPATPEGNEIRYGGELIKHTSKYFGPWGSIAKISNGMSCQNCHLEAGTRPFGNSFGAVASTYPQYRSRSGIVESIVFRINDCMQRSLNGSKIDSSSKEMKAMLAYLKWLGQDVPKGNKPKGTGIVKIPFINRAADLLLGKNIYTGKCQKCHGTNGQGQLNIDSDGYLYPPLWGKNSYNTGAGLYRIGNLAAFIKYNMPYTEVQTDPQLLNEEAWDVAAFIISQPRPDKLFSSDWKDITKKPLDYPFGPYADSFTEQQHKYGPFLSMKKASIK